MSSLILLPENIIEYIYSYLTFKQRILLLSCSKYLRKYHLKKIIKHRLNYSDYTCPYHPRLNCIEQWFNQIKHYIKLDKPKNLIKLKESLNNSINKIKENIIKIILFMLIRKTFIKIQNQVIYHLNIENLKFIKNRLVFKIRTALNNNNIFN